MIVACPMLLEGLLDLLVEGLQAFIEGEDAGGELGNDGGVGVRPHVSVDVRRHVSVSAA
jgi:hypothetical protein